MALRTLTVDNFEDTIIGDEIVIIDFWAPWCAPCKTFGPTFEKVSKEFPDITFAKVNTEEEQELTEHFQIRSIPTTFILRNSVGVFQQAGVIPEQDLVNVLKQIQKLDMNLVRQDIEAQADKALKDTLEAQETQTTPEK